MARPSELAGREGLQVVEQFAPERFVALVFMAGSGVLLWLSQRSIPLGTTYAVWTGIGGAGTFLVGLLFYGDPASLARYAGVALIIAGVVTLKLAH